MAKKNAWDRISGETTEDKARYRDVYNRQQLERSKIAEKTTMGGRAIIALVCGFLIFGIVWVIMSYVKIQTPLDSGLANSYATKIGEKRHDGQYDYITFMNRDEEGNAIESSAQRYIYNRENKILYPNTLSGWPVYIGFDNYDDENVDDEENVDEENTEESENSEESEESSGGEEPRIIVRLADDCNNYQIGQFYSLDNSKDYGYIFENVAKDILIQYPDGTEVEITPAQINDAEYLRSIGFEMQYNNLSEAVIKNDQIVSYKSTKGADWRFYWSKFIIGLLLGGVTFGILYFILKKNLDAQNIMSETADINQYQNDQHIALPEEVQRMYDVFPDVGAHSSVVVSSMISHQMLTNKGLNKVKLSRFVSKDYVDEETGETVYKGTLMRDSEGNVLYDMVPMIDEKFGNDLFTASSVPDEKYARRFFDPDKIDYNRDNKNRDKLQGKVKDKKGKEHSKYNTVADVINYDWELPEYEPQRPAGMYIVDVAPVNTMVLAITRAGKGQTIIEPTIDMWTREKNPNNMVINDPKGELLVKNYVRGTKRGFTIVQFNLINPMKTDIYNPLSLAADAARDGNSTKCAMYVENIAEVFFPVDGADDPLWPNAANNAFKRAAYGMIDFYLEEEKEMRRIAAIKNINQKALELKIDEMWGKVTLYNCYQMFTQLSSRKMKSPSTLLSESDEFKDLPDNEVCKKMNEALEQEFAWDGNKEADMLTVYFSATDMLPKNSMRTLVSNANNALKAMGGAEKMMASVYGIAITAMSFFTDPTISTLTSGTLNQNVDLAGFSFPRRFGARFHKDYLKDNHYVGKQCIWQGYKDKTFSESLGKDFSHTDMVDREGWCKCFLKGCFPEDVAYMKLTIKDVDSDMVIEEFYFKFTKNYQVSYDGKTYAKDPILGTKIVKNGFLTEVKPVMKDGKIEKVKNATSTFKREVIANIANVVAEKSEELYNTPDAPDGEDFMLAIEEVVKEKCKPSKVETNVFMSTFAKYQEKCKMCFLVTPPHLMKYAKLILILIKQLVDLNFDQSYMTKSNQKPLYKTRYMLDELGNLQSEGHGISGFETMLSIGLGQEQQFTLILQTLQQLKDVYGDSVDKIVQGNTSNIIFLKSTDDSMIDTLSKMSGVKHVTYTNSKTITKDIAAVTSFSKNEDKVSYTMSTVEEPVISCNDMLFIPPCNSILFRAGDSPIWNRNETALPMSWRLFTNTIVNPGKDYSLMTVPSLSTAKDFDIKQNQPNFTKLFEKRIRQAGYAKQAVRFHKVAYGYTDDQINRLDADVYADEIMEIISGLTQPDIDMTVREDESENSKELLNQLSTEDRKDIDDEAISKQTAKNTELDAALQSDMIKKHEEEQKKIYARGQISKSDLYDSVEGRITASVNIRMAISSIFTRRRNDFANDTKYFIINANGDLCATDGTVYITKDVNDAEIAAAKRAISDEDARAFAESEQDAEFAGADNYYVTPDFYKFLCSFNGPWPFMKGAFEEQMASAMSGE